MISALRARVAQADQEFVAQGGLYFGISAGRGYYNGPMDDGTTALLRDLIRGQRIAALGTLRQGAPLVSMVLYLPSPDFSALYLHVSRLAWHTQDMLADPRVSLSIAQTDEPANPALDPQRLARVSVRGEATTIPDDAQVHPELKAAWLHRFPDSAVTFELADFSFFRIAPHDARFVAGFGRIHNLSAEALVAVSADVSK